MIDLDQTIKDLPTTESQIPLDDANNVYACTDEQSPTSLCEPLQSRLLPALEQASDNAAPSSTETASDREAGQETKMTLPKVRRNLLFQLRGLIRKRMTRNTRIVTALLFAILWALFYNLLVASNSSRFSFFQDQGNFFLGVNQRHKNVVGPCAINFYGLPRKFKDIVLPSLVENIIRPNAPYACDYFVHYYDRTSERYDRGIESGRRGEIDPEEVRLLSQAVQKEHFAFHIGRNITPPAVNFRKDTELKFFNKYNSLLERIQNEKRADGEFLFLPVKHNFPISTIQNIIKTWHSQQSVWELMESWLLKDEQINQPNPSFRYSRVAMFRVDVLYVNPIDIYKSSRNSIDIQNKYAIVPSFSKQPVNDRMFYGPADAVKIWATGRFDRMKQHSENAPPGDGIHPEQFLKMTIFPAIRDAGIEIVEFPSKDLCFLRVRSDSSIRISDCGLDCVTPSNVQYVEKLIGRPCAVNMDQPAIPILECNEYIVAPPIDAIVDNTLLWQGCNAKPA